MSGDCAAVRSLSPFRVSKRWDEETAAGSLVRRCSTCRICTSACRRPYFLFAQKVCKDAPGRGKIQNLSPLPGLTPHSNRSRSGLLDNSPCGALNDYRRIVSFRTVSGIRKQQSVSALRLISFAFSNGNLKNTSNCQLSTVTCQLSLPRSSRRTPITQFFDRLKGDDAAARSSSPFSDIPYYLLPPGPPMPPPGLKVWLEMELTSSPLTMTVPPVQVRVPS